MHPLTGIVSRKNDKTQDVIHVVDNDGNVIKDKDGNLQFPSYKQGTSELLTISAIITLSRKNQIFTTFADVIPFQHEIRERVVSERLDSRVREQKRQAAAVCRKGGDAKLAGICGRNVRQAVGVRLRQERCVEGESAQCRAAFRADGT